MAATAYSINIHPNPRYLGQALADFVKKVPRLHLGKQVLIRLLFKVGWRSLVIIYEKEEGLVCSHQPLR